MPAGQAVSAVAKVLGIPNRPLKKCPWDASGCKWQSTAAPDQGHFANHVTRVGADNAAAQNFAVTVCFWAVVKQEFGDAFVAAVGNGAA